MNGNECPISLFPCVFIAIQYFKILCSCWSYFLVTASVKMIQHPVPAWRSPGEIATRSQQMGRCLQRFQVEAVVQHPWLIPVLSQFLLLYWDCAQVWPNPWIKGWEERTEEGQSAPRGGIHPARCKAAAELHFPFSLHKNGIFFLLFHSLLVFPHVSSCFSSQLLSCSAGRVSSCYGTGNPQDLGDKSERGVL